MFSGMALVLLILHGYHRLIKSQVYSYHLAIARDGVKAVQDDHLEGSPLVAAFHCDSCLLVTRKDEVVGGCGRR